MDYRLRVTVNGRFQFPHRLIFRIINQDKTIHTGGLQGGTAYRRPGLPDAPLEAAVAAAHDGLDAALADGFVFDEAAAPLIARARAFIRDEVI